MKINLPVYYIVEKDKGVVTCRFKKSFFDPQHFMSDHKSRQNLYIPYGPTIDFDDLKGVAHCFTGDAAKDKSADKYDVEVGKRIAHTRLIKKFYKQLNRYFNNMLKDYMPTIQEIEKYIVQSELKMKNCETHLNYLIEKTKQ